MSYLTSKNILYKQSGEVINVSMDFSNWLSSTSVTLSSPSASVDPSGDSLSLSSVSVSGQTVTLTISAGTNGATYRIQITVETSDGQTLIGDGTLKIRDR